jgi:hypothetical protein
MVTINSLMFAPGIWALTPEDLTVRQWENRGWENRGKDFLWNTEKMGGE